MVYTYYPNRDQNKNPKYIEAKTLFDGLLIFNTVKTLATRINVDFTGLFPQLVILMDGAVKFSTELVYQRQLHIPLTLEYLTLKSYTDIGKQGDLQLTGLIPIMKGRNVLLIDDICDSGRTLTKAVELASKAGALTIKTCSLLVRKGSLFTPDYTGLVIGSNQWVFGYGMDYKNGQLRNLPYIACVDI